MGSRAERTITQLEWYSVTYRSVVAWIITGVVALVASGVGWYYFRLHRPRQAAAAAITQAADHLSQAEPLAEAQQIRETVERARGALGQARGAFAAHEWADARFAALHASDLSLQALEAAKGNNANTKMVRFYRLEGDVRVKHAGEFSWEPASPYMVLNIGDQVKTSSSASAQLIYFDGSVTTIQPGSLLEIRDLFEDPVTKVRRVKEKLSFGEVQSSTQRSNVRGSYHEVATEKVSARAEDAGEFRMAHDKDRDTTVVDTFRGQLQVETGDRRESLSAGERLRTDAEGRMASKERLPGVPRLLAPADQRVFIYEDPSQHRISLNWQDVPGAERYHLLIADQPLFTGPLYDAHRKEATAQLEVGPGTYYWKAAAVTGDGVEGPFSDIRTFRVSSERIKDRDDSVPPELEVSEFVTVGMMVIINGRTEPGATLWVDNERVDIHDDGRFYAVVRLREEGVNEVLLRAQDTAGNETRQSRSAYVEMF